MMIPFLGQGTQGMGKNKWPVPELRGAPLDTTTQLSDCIEPLPYSQRTAQQIIWCKAAIMLFFRIFFLLCVGVARVHAKAAALVQAIADIEKTTQELSIPVVKWDGSILTAFPIGLKSVAVIKIMKKATSSP